MSRFQPHVSRDRDTSKGKSDFANVLTEGWANIFEPFVPVVCTVTSSEGGVCRGATSRPHFFPSFFFLSLFFLFLLDGKTTENNAFEKRCARYALVCVNVGWKMCGVAGGKQEGWNCYSTWFPAKWRSSSLRDRMNWKIPFRKSITPRRQVDRLKKKKKEEDEAALVEKSCQNRRDREERRAWRFDYETSEMNNLIIERMKPREPRGDS